MGASSDQLRCDLCPQRGTTADLLAGWAVGAERGRSTSLCPACARRHVRDIEARLDPGVWPGLRG